MANEQETKPAPKKPRKKKTPDVDAPIPCALVDSVAVTVVTDRHTPAEQLRHDRGDAVVRVDLPTADRAELSRHLVMLAGHVASTLGDPIEGATILVVTNRKKT
jgi:hypothetical protein